MAETAALVQWRRPFLGKKERSGSCGVLGTDPCAHSRTSFLAHRHRRLGLAGSGAFFRDRLVKQTFRGQRWGPGEFAQGPKVCPIELVSHCQGAGSGRPIPAGSQRDQLWTRLQTYFYRSERGGGARGP